MTSDEHDKLRDELEEILRDAYQSMYLVTSVDDLHDPLVERQVLRAALPITRAALLRSVDAINGYLKATSE